jgi:hypothetical protein
MKNDLVLENFYYSENHLPDDFFQRIVELENSHQRGELTPSILEELAFMYKVKSTIFIVWSRILCKYQPRKKFILL